MAQRWKRRPEGSNWGDFGPDDQIGRMNYLTPERRLAGVREVKEGLAFMLSLPLDYPGGDKLISVRHPPKLFAEQVGEDRWIYNARIRGADGGCRDTVCDDGVTLWTQYSTQWDSLPHVGQLFDADDDEVAEMVCYNGYRAGVDILGPDQEGGPYAKKLGIETLAEACPQGRASLVNLHAIYGKEHKAVGYDQLMRAFDQQGVTVEKGDFLLIYTGYDELILGMNKNPDRDVLYSHCTGLDGFDQRLLKWVDDSGVVALCSDNLAVEQEHLPVPPGGHTMLGLHELCLFKQGIFLGELWYLKDLADWLLAHKRSAFLLTAPPLRLPGAVGSPVSPIATV
jgi:kynurenine formamidase